MKIESDKSSQIKLKPNKFKKVEVRTLTGTISDRKEIE